MKGIKSITAVFLCVTLLGSCGKDIPTETVNGAITLTLGLATTKDDSSIVSRAEMSQDELLSTAVIKIYNGDFSGLIRDYSNSAKPQTIYLPCGDYRVDVMAGEVVKTAPVMASWEQKSYKGSSPFTVTAGQITPVQVVANVNNAITKITFDQTIADAFAAGYTLTIGLSDTDVAQQLVYSADNAGEEGYFIADGFEPSLYWKFSGELKDGTAFVKSGEIPAVEQGKRYSMNLKYTEKNGTLSFTLYVDKSTDDQEEEIIFEPISTGLVKSSAYEIWAGHATVHADVDETEYGAENIYFEYRKSNTEDAWVRIDANRDSEGIYSQTITGLIPQTEYEYRLLAPDPTTKEITVIGSPLNITTESAPTIPNASFEDAAKDIESSKYYSFYDPASSIPANQTKWWDSGNMGSTTVGSSYTICDPDTDNYKEGDQSARLHSEYVVIKFAAGNLFSGEFAGLEGTKGGKVNFGRPFTGRPTGLRLWVKYSTSTVGRVDGYPDDDPVTKDVDYDRAQIKIALGTWDYRTYGGTSNCPVQVNTTDVSTFVDFNTDISTIAYGRPILQGDASNSTNVWQQITIPLEYKDQTAYPSYIIISCAASMLGDYFTGSEESELWVDGMELLYE